MKKINYALCLLALILTGCNNNNTSTSGKGSVSSSASTSNSTNVSTKPSTSTSTSVIKTLKEISIEDYPLKTEYEINETLSVDGVTLRLTYTDETSEVIDVTMDMVTVPDMSKVGIASVVITYKGFSASYNISIKNSNIKKEKPTISFVVDNNPFENGTQFVVNAIKNIEVTVTEGVQYNVYYTKDDGATNLGNVAPTEVGKYAINVVTIENDSYESVSDFRWYEIVNEDEGKLYLKMALSAENIPEDLKAICEIISEHFPPRRRGKNWKWRVPFSTKRVDVSKSTDEEVICILNDLYTEAMQFEKQLVDVMKE